MLQGTDDPDDLELPVANPAALSAEQRQLRAALDNSLLQQAAEQVVNDALQQQQPLADAWATGQTAVTGSNVGNFQAEADLALTQVQEAASAAALKAAAEQKVRSGGQAGLIIWQAASLTCHVLGSALNATRRMTL